MEMVEAIGNPNIIFEMQDIIKSSYKDCRNIPIGRFTLLLFLYNCIIRDSFHFVRHYFIKPVSAPSFAVFSGGYKVLIDAVCPHQIFMGALFRNSSVGYDQYFVGVADGIQPVGYNQQGFALAELTYGLLDIAFIIGIHAGSSFV